MNTPKWYQKNWGIVLLILLFFPVGLILMWKHANWRTTTKAVITGLIALALVYGPEKTEEDPIVQIEPSEQGIDEDEKNEGLDLEEVSAEMRREAEQARQDSIAKAQEEHERLKCISDAEDFHRELQAMHTELQSFRKTSDFRYYGFAPGGQYHSWLEKIGKMKDDPRDRCCLMYKRCVAGDLEMLGMEYASNNGRDTDYSMRTAQLFGGDNSRKTETKPTPASRNWYEGGTLHKATIGRWKTSTEQNKLATCGDFMAAYDKSIPSMTVLRARAVALKSCIDVATSGLDYTNDIEVSTMAALCIQELGY